MGRIRQLKNIGGNILAFSVILFFISMVLCFIFGFNYYLFLPSVLLFASYCVLIVPSIILATIICKSDDTDFNDDCSEHISPHSHQHHDSTCTLCRGTGRCITCRGTGYPGWSGKTPTCKTKCMQCLGYGVCPRCGGKGTV